MARFCFKEEIKIYSILLRLMKPIFPLRFCLYKHTVHTIRGVRMIIPSGHSLPELFQGIRILTSQT